MRITSILILLLLGSLLTCSAVMSATLPQQPTTDKPDRPEITDLGPGDRVKSSLGPITPSLDSAARSSASVSSDYKIGVGDVLAMQVRGKVDLHYGLSDTETKTDGSHGTDAPVNFEVMPDGLLHLPLIGSVEAAGMTIPELQGTIKKKLSSFYKNFSVDLSVASPGLHKVWVSGQVSNPGTQSLPSSATVLEAVLKADILPTGSTRRVQLTRKGQTRQIDVYGIVVRGDLENNVVLETGDEIYVPPATDCVVVTGEVARSGQYEIVPAAISSKNEFRMSDLVSLCQGLLATAAESNVIVKRRTTAGEITAVHVDLRGSEDIELKPGDEILVPSIADYQPTVRLVGEFKGDGVYQRSAGTVLNKSGVYSLSKGETAGDVIIRTGGTTPQADLTKAKIERHTNGTMQVIPLDLDKLITRQDKSADVTLESGDTIVLPALMDKVYVFGQVIRPGSYDYEPDRRVLDYLAKAGGPGPRGRSSVVVVRGGSDKPEITRISTTKGMQGGDSDNPIMKPGDVLYVPEGIIADWRDLSQIISTVRLLTLF